MIETKQLAAVGRKPPPLAVSAWVQGSPVDFADLLGRVILVEVFQVNCPGCFLYALPQAVKLYETYGGQDLAVIGIATAFEDFDKNNLANLTGLVQNGEVIGETHRVLSQHNLLRQDRLPYRLPFPIAMDHLIKRAGTTAEEIKRFIESQIPNFPLLTESQQETLKAQARRYLHSLEYDAVTFQTFDLKGTPSAILIDKKGILRYSLFGDQPNLQELVLGLLQD